MLIGYMQIPKAEVRRRLPSEGRAQEMKALSVLNQTRQDDVSAWAAPKPVASKPLSVGTVRRCPFGSVNSSMRLTAQSTSSAVAN